MCMSPSGFLSWLVVACIQSESPGNSLVSFGNRWWHAQIVVPLGRAILYLHIVLHPLTKGRTQINLEEVPAPAFINTFSFYQIDKALVAKSLLDGTSHLRIHLTCTVLSGHLLRMH